MRRISGPTGSAHSMRPAVDNYRHQCHKHTDPAIQQSDKEYRITDRIQHAGLGGKNRRTTRLENSVFVFHTRTQFTHQLVFHGLQSQRDRRLSYSKIVSCSLLSNASAPATPHRPGSQSQIIISQLSCKKQVPAPHQETNCAIQLSDARNKTGSARLHHPLPCISWVVHNPLYAGAGGLLKKYEKVYRHPFVTLCRTVRERTGRWLRLRPAPATGDNF